MASLTPYLRFNDSKCKEAFLFYKSILGGELVLQTVGESPIAKEMPEETHNKIMHASLITGGISLYGSDMMRDKAIVGDNVALTLVCESDEEIRNLFEKLKEGGDVFMPLEIAFWGDLFGVLTDKYGIEWMLNFPTKK